MVLADGKRNLKVDRLIPHTNLPNCRSNDRRHTRGKGLELWLVDGDRTLVDPNSVVSCLSVWLCDLPEPPSYDFYVSEILYQFEGRWKYREIAKRQLLPGEHTSPPQLMPTMKIFLDIYIDSFGTFRNVYHSLDGVYLQLGNMPLSLRKQLRNHFLIGFVPFGANLTDFIQPVLKDIRRLEQGLIMNTIHGKRWVVGALIVLPVIFPRAMM